MRLFPETATPQCGGLAQPPAKTERAGLSSQSEAARATKRSSFDLQNRQMVNIADATVGRGSSPFDLAGYPTNADAPNRRR